MVLAVDAGHQMKKNKVIWYMFFTIIGGVIFVGSQAWEWATFIQGDYGAVQTKGGNILQFGEYKTIDGEEVFKRVAVEEFTTAAHSERTQHQSKNGIWFLSENSLPAFTINDVYHGLETHPNILVRTQTINEEGKKTVLSRAASLAQVKNNGKRYVKGANLRSTNMVHHCSQTFSSLSQGFTDSTFFQVL